jgi:RNA polymerase sigma-B factor
MTRTRAARTDWRDSFVEYARSGDTALRDVLVEAHLGIAVHLARRFAGRGETEDDLVQVASVALLGAVQRFDPSLGVEFSTFATRTILGELKRHFRDKGWFVRAPRRVQELYLKVSEATAALGQRLGRSPTIGEIAEWLGVGEDAVIEALEAGQGYRAASLDAVGPEGDTLGERVGTPDPQLEVSEDRMFLAPALARLAPRERAIVEMRFAHGMTQSQIAARVGISQMHVSRLLKRSLDTLRSAYGDVTGATGDADVGGADPPDAGSSDSAASQD